MSNTKKMWLVWNKAMNECAGFDDYGDAYFASTGSVEYVTSCGVSALADEFREMYEDDQDLVITEIEVPLCPH